MPDRQRHNGFLWALICSLIINLLFVFALLTPRFEAPELQPLVVSLAVNDRALSRQSPAISAPIGMPAPAKNQKTGGPPPNYRPQRTKAAQVLPGRNNEEEVAAIFAPAPTPEGGRAETALSSSAPTRAGATVPSANEITGSLSIWEDKIAGDLYTAPEYLAGEKPSYPKRAERNGWEGTVLLTLSINAKGEVEKVGIAKSSGYELLDQQARVSVGSWRFNPARRNGVAIAVTVQQPVIFRPARPERIQ